MKSMYQSLVDYEMALLQAIAACRAIALTTFSKQEAVDALTDTLLSPAETAIMLTSLTNTEQEALQLLLANGGQIDSARFLRTYGEVRLMGAARLERERPWENPVNAAEGLWYKGLIFKMGQITSEGSKEIIYIPDDLLPLLNNSKLGSVVSTTFASFTVSPAPIPVAILSGEGRLRENIFNLLVYLQTTPVRLQRGSIPPKDKQALADTLLPPLAPSFLPVAELDFLLHLAQRADLLETTHGRLKPDRDPTRAWLQATPAQQTRTLQNTWRADPTWNDLWHVPGLAPQPTGWENSPMLARSKILNYLSDLATAPDTWYALDEFVGALKRIDPDFQRPNGDYNSWYIQDANGQLLMGFENWDQVEGALIHHLLEHILPALGVVDLGLPAENSPPARFRITAQGKNFLAGKEISPEPLPQPRYLRVDANFLAQVLPNTSLYDRFQLARFTTLERREPDRIIYRLTQTSVGKALRNGVTAEQMVAFLARATNNRTPLKVVETLRIWGNRQDTARIEQTALLRLKNEQLVTELQNNPTLRPLLGEVIGPTTILIPAENLAEVRRILTELGYLD
jgi:hypothetical protein